jgi:nitroreductase
MKVTFLKVFHYRPKLSRQDAWKSTVIRYQGGVEYDVSDKVVAAAIENGALNAPEKLAPPSPVEPVTEGRPGEPEGE